MELGRPWRRKTTVGLPVARRALLVAAEDENHQIGFFGDGYSRCNSLGVENGIAEHNFVGIPVGFGFGNLAAFGVEDFRVRSYFVLNSLQDADAASRLVAVAAEVDVGGIGADYGDVLVLGFVER